MTTIDSDKLVGFTTDSGSLSRSKALVDEFGEEGVHVNLFRSDVCSDERDNLVSGGHLKEEGRARFHVVEGREGGQSGDAPGADGAKGVELKAFGCFYLPENRVDLMGTSRLRLLNWFPWNGQRRLWGG